MVGVGWRQAKLGEDVADVLFDGSLGNGDAVGDGDVGPAFGHEGENVVLARG